MAAREMQKQFEQRLITINPEFAVNQKLTSDVIFQYLNQYTQSYVKANYIALDQLQNNNRNILKSIHDISNLISNTILSKETKTQDNLDNYIDYFELPTDFFLYIRSTSKVTSNFQGTTTDNTAITTNNICKVDDINKVVTAYYNNIILPNPYIIIDNQDIRILHDKYTTIDTISITYYRLPKLFNVLNVDNITVLDHCELSDSACNEIIEGAVNMFIEEYKYKLQVKNNNKQ